MITTGNIQQEDNSSKFTGVLGSIAFNLLLAVLLMAYVLPLPPPPEALVLIEFPDVAIEPVETHAIPPVIARGDAPERVRKSGGPDEIAPADLKLSDKTRAPKPNSHPVARPGKASEHGDVEHYEPVTPKVNTQALFSSNNNGVEDSDNRTNRVGTNTYPGTGNSAEPTRGPNAYPGSIIQQKGINFSLEGRSAYGKWPLPEYTVQKEGKVLVNVTVDRQGKVVRASINPIGSTTADATLQNAALEAAKKATFNADPNAATMQTGTITYVFKLK